MTALEKLLTTAEALADAGFLEETDMVLEGEDSWNGTFAEQCFVQAFGTSTAQGMLCNDSKPFVSYSAENYKGKEMYYDTPRIGDLVFFRRQTGASLSGIVSGLNSTAIFTIEGTAGTGQSEISVSRQWYLLTDNAIDGYVRADWGKLPVNGGSLSGYDRQMIIAPAGKFYVNRVPRITNNWTEEVIPL